MWVTKNREPLIQTDFEADLFRYLVNKCAELGIYVYAINGWVDHVHMIAAIPPKRSVADVVKRLKGASSHYVNHDLRPAHSTFAWQPGYGCLTLGETQRPKAVAYVENQKHHHAARETNAWLEHISTQDEGPAETERLVDSSMQLGEPFEPYHELDGDPYPF